MYNFDDQIKLNRAIRRFIETNQATKEALAQFLMRHCGHPDYYVDHTAAVIDNLVELNHERFENLLPEKRIHLLTSLCLTVEIAFTMKQWGDMLASKKAVWYWTPKYGLFFSSLHDMTIQLNALQKSIYELGEGFTGRELFVEGEGEQVYIQWIQRTRLISYQVPIIVIGGKDNIKNLRQLILDKNRSGMRVQLCYDSDGQLHRELGKLRKEVLIEREFAFRRDFESSFPPRVLGAAIAEYSARYKPNSCQPSAHEIESLLNSNKPFIKQLEEWVGYNINKRYFAEFLAFETIRLYEQNPTTLEGMGPFRNHEIGRFLRFVIEQPEEPTEFEKQREQAFEETVMAARDQK